MGPWMQTAVPSTDQSASARRTDRHMPGRDIASPNQTLACAVLSAIVVVTVVYIVVALGTAMLIGADQIVEHEEIALAVAAREALGTAGRVTVTANAAFSSGSAINSTLCATARLAHEVASNGELPATLDHTNGRAVGCVRGHACRHRDAVDAGRGGQPGVPVHFCGGVRAGLCPAWEPLDDRSGRPSRNGGDRGPDRGLARNEPLALPF